MKFLAGLFLALVSLSSQAQTNDECMASTIYHEARTESLAGRRAVYDVVINRVVASKKSVCWVVKSQGQFSWWPEKPIMKMDAKLKQLLTSTENENRILNNENYFFQKHLNPKWARKMSCQIIESHKYCG